MIGIFDWHLNLYCFAVSNAFQISTKLLITCMHHAAVNCYRSLLRQEKQKCSDAQLKAQQAVTELSKQLNYVNIAHLKNKQLMQTKESDLCCRIARLIDENERLQRDIVVMSQAKKALRLRMDQLNADAAARTRGFEERIAELERLLAVEREEVERLLADQGGAVGQS